MLSKWIDFHDGILCPRNDQSSTIPTTFVKTNFSTRDENISDLQNHHAIHPDNNTRNVHKDIALNEHMLLNSKDSWHFYHRQLI